MKRFGRHVYHLSEAILGQSVAASVCVSQTVDYLSFETSVLLHLSPHCLLNHVSV